VHESCTPLRPSTRSTPLFCVDPRKTPGVHNFAYPSSRMTHRNQSDTLPGCALNVRDRHRRHSNGQPSHRRVSSISAMPRYWTQVPYQTGQIRASIALLPDSVTPPSPALASIPGSGNCNFAGSRKDHFPAVGNINRPVTDTSGPTRKLFPTPRKTSTGNTARFVTGTRRNPHHTLL